MEHYLVCTVSTEDGRETAQLEGFVQNCDLRAAQQYFATKRRKAHSSEINPNMRLFQLVEVK